MAFEFGTNGRLTWLALAALIGLSACGKPPAPVGGIAPRAPGETRPNILVIEVDHLGPELGAYGDKAAVTPNLDRLARDGVRFEDAYAASGGEDASGAALLTGVQPSTIGVVQEWTGPARWAVAPPPEVKAWPELLRRTGYYTFHVGARPDAFGAPASLWDENATAPGAAWTAATIRQPFAAVVELTTLPEAQAPETQKSVWDRLQFWRAAPVNGVRSVADARRIDVPAYLPDTPEVRAALKAEYDRDHRVDDQVGALLARLDKAGVLKSTVVIFTSKAGPARPRAERTVYDSGVRTPLIVRWLDGRGRGSVRRDLVSGVDLAPSLLRLGGVQPLAWMQGRDRLTPSGDPARFVYSVQDRVDQAYERVFAVRDGRYLYLLNLAPQTPLTGLARPGPLIDALAAARKAGRLTPTQAKLFDDQRPEAELYDLRSDPQATRNLAEDPSHTGDVQRLAAALNAFATSAPDSTTATTQDLLDSYKPGGTTPAAAAPSAELQPGRVALASITPGASILWRLAETAPWRLYTGPISPGAAKALQAKAVRYGFADSAVTAVTLKP